MTEFEIVIQTQDNLLASIYKLLFNYDMNNYSTALEKKRLVINMGLGD